MKQMPPYHTSDASSSVAPKTGETPAQKIEALDALFEYAGLSRNLRGKAAGVTLRARENRARMEGVVAEELSQPATDPGPSSNGVHSLSIPGWEKYSWLWHGFSTRKGGLSRVYCPEDAPGELNLGFTEADSREIVLQNRRLFAEAVTGDSATPLVCLRQIHSTLLRAAGSEDADRETPWRGDALMTDEPGLLLGIQTADCIPVLVADRKRHVVAVFHAGWRGTVERIVEKGVGSMRLAYGCRPEDLIAAIGPGIGQCCYAVGEEVISAFEAQFSYGRKLFREVYSSDAIRTRYPMLFLTQRAPGHSPIGPSLHLDLVEANRRQLLDAGLKPRSIQSTRGCTCCQTELFFSHRASRGYAGRMMSVIGIRPDAER
jgi:hypothetical protein